MQKHVEIWYHSIDLQDMLGEDGAEKYKRWCESAHEGHVQCLILRKQPQHEDYI